MQRRLLPLLVGLSYLLAAGAPTWTLGPLFVITLVAAAVSRHSLLNTASSTRALDMACAAVAAAVALQVVPLPRALIDAVSPHAGRVRALLQVALPVDDPNAWLPWSIRASAGWESLATFVLALLTFWVARAIFSAGGSVRTFCRALAIIGVAGAVAAVIQRTATPDLVLGVLSPESRASTPFGAFVNRNHFAGWLLLIVPVVAGYIVAHVRIHLADHQHWADAVRGFLRSSALPVAAALAGTLSVLVLTLSRSAALGLGAAAVFAWIAARPRLDVAERRWLFLVGAGGLTALTTFVLIDLDGWAGRLENTLTLATRADSRLVIWRETLPIVRDFWTVGTGAGTYSDAMLIYQQSRIWIPHLAAWAHFNQAHNHYLHVMAEGGLMLAVPVAIALAALGRSARRALAQDRNEMYWIRLGAAAALVGAAAQSLWEIPLVMPANGVLAACLAALVVHERRPDRHQHAGDAADEANRAGRSVA